MDLKGLMKVFIKFNNPPSYLTTLNFAGVNLKSYSQELEKYPKEIKIIGIRKVQKIPIIRIV